MIEQNTDKPVNSVRNVLLAPLRFAYGLYAIGAFLVLALCTLLATLCLPGVQRRRAAARAGARAFLWAAGMRLITPPELRTGGCSASSRCRCISAPAEETCSVGALAN